jgi:hypothetical protein
MKFPLHHSRERGGVLFTALILSLLVSLVVGALLMLSKQQNYLTARSMTWCSEIPTAEAGVEEALAHINASGGTWMINGYGWQKDISGKFYSRSRTVGSGGSYFYTTISATDPPTITSIGYGRIPLQTAFTYRTILVTTKKAPPVWGIVGKNGVILNGSGLVDSFNSTNNAMSTAGRFDPLKRQDHAGVGTLSTNKPAINTGTAKIYGFASTGPGGTVAGTVGDGGWSSTTTGIQAGRVSDDFNMAIPDVVLPSMPGAKSPTIGTLVGGILYEYVFTSGDYIVASDLKPDKTGVLISGNVRLYVTGSFIMSGGASLTIAPGGSLELYVKGNAEFKGNGILNLTGYANMVSIYGLSTSTSMHFGGNSELIARIYAPTADITLAGNADISGAILGKTVTMQGNADIHYDEALGMKTQEYRVASWEEL